MEYNHLCQVSNPVPRVVHPPWLHKKVREKDDKMRQRKLNVMFSSMKKANEEEVRNDTNGKEHVLQEQEVVDLEDFGSKGKSSNSTPRPVVRSYENNGKTSSSKEKVDHGQSMNPVVDIPVEDNIDSHVDYQGWLNQRKRKWKQVREKKKKQKLDSLDKNTQRNGVAEIHSGVSDKRQAQGRTGVNSYFERHELALTRSHWQVMYILFSYSYAF